MTESSSSSGNSKLLELNIKPLLLLPETDNSCPFHCVDDVTEPFTPACELPPLIDFDSLLPPPLVPTHLLATDCGIDATPYIDPPGDLNIFERSETTSLPSFLSRPSLAFVTHPPEKTLSKIPKPNGLPDAAVAAAAVKKAAMAYAAELANPKPKKYTLTAKEVEELKAFMQDRWVRLSDLNIKGSSTPYQ